MKKRILFLLLVCLFHQAPAQTAAVHNFTVKAFHLDLRIQVMTMPALKIFAKHLQQGGINTLILEYEATYPYKKHPLIANRYAFTKEEISSFVAFCNQLGIDVIPLQQSFGHVEYILRHYRYASLREDEKDLSQVCPLQTAGDSVLFSDLYTELAAVHTSRYIHIGGDETLLLGHCARCRAKAEKEGISKLYIDYINMLCRIAIRLGKRPVLWADIALKYPEALQLLPKETIFVDWNYGWALNRFGDHQKLVESGYEIWGAPALRSSPDNYFLTQWEKHFNNIRDFIPVARQLGYKGIVMTSWSTSGTYSYLYESENNLSQLYAIRQVYPVTGFNILLAAFMKSITTAGTLNIEAFIADYCSRAYGFTQSQGRQFWQALIITPYEVENGIVKSPVPLSLAALADSVTKAADEFHKLKPLKNIEEFEQYRLMADIRVQYIRFLEIEKQVNENDFSQAAIPSLLQKLQALMATAALIDQRFIALNKNSFYMSELKLANQYRNIMLQLLYDRLNKIR